MDKKQLSESDICDKFIRPVMGRAGWHRLDQIVGRTPCAGRVVVRGAKAYRNKSTVLRADYALFFKTNIPLAVAEANRQADRQQFNNLYGKYGAIYKALVTRASFTPRAPLSSSWWTRPTCAWTKRCLTQSYLDYALVEQVV